MKKTALLLGGILLVLLVALAQGPSGSVKNLQFQPGDEFNLQIGKSKIVLKRDGTILIEGSNIQILSSKDLDIKIAGGSMINGKKILQN